MPAEPHDPRETRAAQQEHAPPQSAQSQSAQSQQPPAAQGSPDAGARARAAAREALARARAEARARGEAALPASRGTQRPPGGDGDAQRSRRTRRDDPQPLNAAIEGLLDDQGWRTAAAAGSVFGRWAHIVGPELAAHTRPDGLTGGELTVIADSTAWATQVRLLAAHLVRRLNAELGAGAVRQVRVRGPQAPRRPGEWRVRGGRGPRDDYG